ncbi:MAG: DNA-binding domain-containing protein [Legionellales bacterium]|jgi:hypothetical protein
MNTLNQLQDEFQNYLLDKNDTTIYTHIISTEKMPAAKRLHIYANAYYARLVEALGSTYPALLNYLGFDDFYQLGCEYAKAHPSTYRSIRWFGDQFANYLPDHLAEIAKIEWTMYSVFDSKNEASLQLEELAKIPPESWSDMKLQPHASVRRLDLNWNSIQIWQDLIEEKQPNATIKNAYTVPWIFWRKDLDNQYCSLETEDAYAFDALIKGEDFGTICEKLLKFHHEDQVGLRAASLLKGWTQAGLIGKVSY